MALLLALGLTIQHPLLALAFMILGFAFLGGLGMIARVHAIKFDQMAAITNFIVTPLAFLSSTFYSIEALPAGLQQIIHINPIFYLIDGVRYAVIGVSDSRPWLGLGVSALSVLIVTGIAWRMLHTGYRLKP